MKVGRISISNDPLQGSWSQVILILIIVFSGIVGTLLPISRESQYSILLAMFLALTISFVYFRFIRLHQRDEVEMLVDVLLSLSIFWVMYSAGRFGLFFFFLSIVLAIIDSLIYSYPRLFLVLLWQSVVIFVYYALQRAILPEGYQWIMLFNVLSLWLSAHFVWLYAQDVNKISLHSNLNRAQVDYLKELEKKRSEFLHIAAHQLKNPLAIIHFVLIGLASAKNLSKQKQKEIAQATFQAKNAIDFLEDITRYLNLERSTTTVRKDRVEFETLVKEVIMELAEIAQKKRIHITKHIAGVIPPLITDRVYLKVVITNLVDNAIKYSKFGSKVSITISASSHFVEFVIRDHGIGISRVDQLRLFEKFFRGANAKEFLPNGTGLGLYLVKKILRKIGGQISCQSELGRGSKFTVLIPIPKD